MPAGVGIFAAWLEYTVQDKQKDRIGMKNFDKMSKPALDISGRFDYNTNHCNIR